MDTSIADAIAAAGRHYVNGRGNSTLDKSVHRDPPSTGVKSDGTIVWHLYGESTDGTDLAARWGGGADSKDPKTYPAFTATVNVVGPSADP
jgi:hypothetical protein